MADETGNKVLEKEQQTDKVVSSPVMSTYGRFPVTLIKGKGSYVWDEEGKKYLDYTSGIAVCNLGHVPDAVQAKLREQMDHLWHCSNLFHIPAQQQLAELLTSHSCADQVFFCNSGAEANEAAIKIARRYSQHVLGKQAFEIVTFKQSFHGRTLATLTATGQEKIQHGFQPLMPGFRYLSFNDPEALEQVVNEHTCAVLVELVQGEGGVIPADLEWVQQLAQICQEHDILLMVDEIQTGIGRTGSLFAYEQYGIKPDVITLAKGLGSGFPIGAMMAKASVAQSFDPGSHGSTFGGNPLAVTAGLATLNYILQQSIIEESKEIGVYLNRCLNELKDQHPIIKQIRGKGLLQGIVIDGSAMEIVKQALQKNLLILTAGATIVRVLPPLTTTKKEVDECISIMDEIFSTI